MSHRVLNPEQFKDMFHTSPPFNRFSIRRLGLEAREPEHHDDLPKGVYLSKTRKEAASRATEYGEDLWRVSVPHDFPLHTDPVYPDVRYVPHDIPPEHVRLVTKGSLATYFGGSENVPSRADLRRRLRQV